MQELPTDLIDKACRIFLTLAYPGGEETIPAKRRVYLELPPGQPLIDFLQGCADARALYQPVKDHSGAVTGCALRLGCAAFQHLKLKVQKLANTEPPVWTFLVDTHDALNLPPDHPEIAGWKLLQQSNRQLKEKIERAWEQAGLVTFNSLLRDSLQPPPDGHPV